MLCIRHLHLWNFLFQLLIWFYIESSSWFLWWKLAIKLDYLHFYDSFLTSWQHLKDILLFFELLIAIKNVCFLIYCIFILDFWIPFAYFPHKHNIPRYKICYIKKKILFYVFRVVMLQKTCRMITGFTIYPGNFFMEHTNFVFNTPKTRKSMAVQLLL